MRSDKSGTVPGDNQRGADHCIVGGGVMISAKMTLLVGIRDDDDIVIASDGRRRPKKGAGGNLFKIQKTIRLNTELCIGFAGSTEYIRDVLRGLEVHLPLDDATMFEVWEGAEIPLSIDYRQAKDKVQLAISEILTKWPEGTDEGCLPATLLVGMSTDGPKMCSWGTETDWRPIEVPNGCNWYSAIGIVPAKGSREHDEFMSRLKPHQGSYNSEIRLVKAIRYCSNVDRGENIGKNVLCRRLGKQFALDWHCAH